MSYKKDKDVKFRFLEKYTKQNSVVEMKNKIVKLFIGDIVRLVVTMSFLVWF